MGASFILLALSPGSPNIEKLREGLGARLGTCNEVLEMVSLPQIARFSIKCTIHSLAVY